VAGPAYLAELPEEEAGVTATATQRHATLINADERMRGISRIGVATATDFKTSSGRLHSVNNGVHAKIF
jgi:hypothetical protein